MIKQGRGAYFDAAEKTKVSKDGMILLKLMMEDPLHKRTASGWSRAIDKTAQVTSGFLSELKGLDLIKSTGDNIMLTDEELDFATRHRDVWVFWIGGVGQPICKRAENAISQGLTDIRKGYYNFDLDLWPNRPEKIVTLRGSINDVRDKQLLIHFNVDEDKMLRLVELSAQGEVMINIESM